ncbi:hypothetical protein DS884_02795 [Tenacibaculum sp. E3R01]|uniref:hypothetical protein n=1 Tax=Tenacibaculum sp. E3R01 TaxID=2267227 RepID=UPI000DE9FCD2|nr:hypothetical protein [Tenacibaculum sp. E3R01]RBW61948.1 hypothetical protein DS884_02795 [Tenacibaculum sp. E3R01]
MTTNNKIKKNIFFLILFLISSNNIIYSQDIHDKLSTELCQCLEKKQIKDPNKLAPCFEDIIINNIKEIKKHYNVETIEEINMVEIGNKIGAKLILECKYALNTFTTGTIGNEKKVKKQSDLKCSNLRKGEFYYLTPSLNPKVLDTTFVTISNNMFLERMKNGRTYSLLKIKWKKNCEFDLLFKESNDPIKREISKKGDVYKYEILQNNQNSVFLRLNWLGKDYQFELFKLK